MSDRKYATETTGPDIEAFLRPLLERAGFRVQFEILDAHWDVPLEPVPLPG